MTPDPTDAELDEWERPLITGSSDPRPLRLIKALRACRQQVAEFGEEIDRLRSGGIAEAALDNLPSVAKQGETDDD